MSLKRLFFIGFISFCVCLCIYAPAQLMGVAFNQFSGGRLDLANSQGTLWQGSAHVLLNNLAQPSEALDLGKVSWDTQPLQLLAGKFAVSVTHNQGAPFWMTLDTSRLHIEHATFSLPTEIVSTLVPSLKAAALGGQLAIRCDNFSLTRQEILGQAEIDWNQASSALSLLNPLGNYHTKLAGSGSGLTIQLSTLSAGPLIMQGSGRWSASEGLHFEGTAEAEPTAKLQLQELLRVMGNETTAGSGKYQLRF